MKLDVQTDEKEEEDDTAFLRRASQGLGHQSTESEGGASDCLGGQRLSLGEPSPTTD